jgi:hypothetical protein
MPLPAAVLLLVAPPVAGIPPSCRYAHRMSCCGLPGKRERAQGHRRAPQSTLASPCACHFPCCGLGDDEVFLHLDAGQGHRRLENAGQCGRAAVSKCRGNAGAPPNSSPGGCSRDARLSSLPTMPRRARSTPTSLAPRHLSPVRLARHRYNVILSIYS